MSPKTMLYVGLTLLSIGTTMSALALVSPYWRTGYGRLEGIYYYCNGGDCNHLGAIDNGDEGWWRFVQVMMPICTLLAILSQTAGVFYFVKRSKDEKVDPKIPLACMVLGIVSGTLLIAVGLAYNMGVYRDITGVDKGFCAHFMNAMPPIIIFGSVWVRTCWAYENKTCSEDKQKQNSDPYAAP